MFIKIKAKLVPGRDGPCLQIDKTNAEKIKRGGKSKMSVMFRINESQACTMHDMNPTGNGNFQICIEPQMIESANIMSGNYIFTEIKFFGEERNSQRLVLSKFRVALIKNNNARKTWMVLGYGEKKKILTALYKIKSKKSLDDKIKKIILNLSQHKSTLIHVLAGTQK